MALTTAIDPRIELALRSVDAATVAALARPVSPDYCPHRPTDRQLAFLALSCREAFYGGAAGGGKSDALLMAALQYVHVPGYQALILRKNFGDADLPDAIMDRARGWLTQTSARSIGGGKEWVFPSGATLTFGYLQKPNDRYRYQSAAFHYVAFDEVTQFTEVEYRYLFSRLRRLRGSPVPSRMRAAGNPDGIGFEWVKARFVDPGRPPHRVYIPARLEDNPYLDQADYEASLAELDPVLRRRLLLGDWSARAGGEFFDRSWFPVDQQPQARHRGRAVRFWDLAATEDPKKPANRSKDPDWTVGVLMRERGGDYWIEDVQRFRERPNVVEQRIRQTAEADGERTVVWIEEEGGASGKSLLSHYRRNVLPGRAVRALRQGKTTGAKDARIRILSSRAEAGAIRLVSGAWIPAFLDEAQAYPDVMHDDQLDAAASAYLALSRTPSGAGDQVDAEAPRGEGLSHTGAKL